MTRARRAPVPFGALALAGALLVAGGAGAQERPDSVRRDTAVLVEGVVVSAVRPVATTGGASAVFVRPDSLRLPPAPTLEQALRVLPFVRVRENSRGEAEVTVRGSESRQTAILLDGMPLTLGWDHRTDPSVVPITGARSILLVRGLHSLLYGPNVLGGVVEINVAGGADATLPAARYRARAGVDQVGGRSLGVVAERPYALPGGGMELRGGVGYRARSGVPLPEGVEQPAAGEAGMRINSDLRHFDGFLASRFRGHSGAWMGLTASGYTAERGVPPELHVAEPRLWRYPVARRGLAVLSGGTGERSTRWGTGDLEASVGVDAGATGIESYESLAYRRVVGTEDADDRTVTVRLLGDHSLGRAATLRAAVTLADVRHAESVDGEAAMRYRQRLWSAGSEVALPVAPGARLSGGLVMDGADTPESGDKPALGRLAAWGARLGASALARGGDLRLHASLSRRARFPALRELYSGSLGRFEPNPGLRPEVLLGAEAGATSRHGSLELQLVAFHHRLADAVVRTSTPAGKFRRENRDQIRSTGLELLADWSRGGLALVGDLLVQDVRVIDSSLAGEQRRPEHQPGLRAGVNATVALPLHLAGTAAAQYTGRQFCVHLDAGREVALAGSGRVDAGLQRAWMLGGDRALRASLSLDNASDAVVYDQCGLPQPGRTLRLSVEVAVG